jgi:hypothetical protein
VAADVCPAPRELLEKHLLAKQEQDRLAVAAYDHVGGEWSFYWCATKGRCERRTGRPFELTLGNAPLLELGSRDRHMVVVYDTNTLLFMPTGLEATETEREDVGILRAFSSLFFEALGVLGAVPTPRAAPPAPASMLGQPKLKPEDDLLKSLAVLRDNDWATVQSLKGALEEADAARAATEQAFDSGFRYVQAVERGRQSKAPARVDLEALVESLTRLAAARADLSRTSRACSGPVSSLGEALSLLVDRSLAGTLEDRETRLQDLIFGLRSAPLELGRAGCSPAQASDLVALAGEVEETRAEKGLPSVAGAPQDVALRWRRLRTGLAEHLLWVGSLDLVDKAAEAADGILADQKAILQTAAKAGLLEDRIAKQPEFCLQAHGFAVVNEPDVPLAWDKDRTYTFRLKATGPFAADVVAAHADDVALSYQLRQKRWTFDLGFGVIFAFGDDTRDPTYAAVASPVDPSAKVIARTADASRSGAPLATLILEPPGSARSRFGPALDLGVGLDPDRLFLSVGASVRITPFARLGAAWGFHKVKVLAEPQKELTTVTSSDDITTRDEVKQGFQLSLAITLKGFNPFKGDD